jgi:hypothetical protein
VRRVAQDNEDRCAARAGLGFRAEQPQLGTQIALGRDLAAETDKRAQSAVLRLERSESMVLGEQRQDGRILRVRIYLTRTPS